MQRQQPRRQPHGTAEAPGHPEDDPGDPFHVAATICYRLLSARARSRAELGEALQRKGVPADVAEQTLGKFARAHLIDDGSFARAWVDARHRTKGLAGAALKAELGRKGVDPAHIARALDQLGPEREEQRARALVQAKARSFSRHPPQVQLRRAVAMLARKGYGPGVALRAAKAELPEADDEAGGAAPPGRLDRVERPS